jgi:hypothetical protein
MEMKDKMILDLLQHIIESGRASKVPRSGFSLELNKRAMFNLPLVKRLEIKQSQPAKMSVSDFVLQPVSEAFALRTWLTAMN